MIKFRFLMAKDQEEIFINRQAAKGYDLVSISPFRLMPPLETRFYNFKKTNGPRKIYRLDSRNFTDKESKQDYLQLMKDDGWTQFNNNYTSNSLYNMYYFYHDYSSSKDKIFSDESRTLTSKESYYNRILIYSMILLAVYFMIPSFHSTISSNNVISLVLSNWFPIILVITIIGSLILKVLIRKSR